MARSVFLWFALAGFHSLALDAQDEFLDNLLREDAGGRLISGWRAFAEIQLSGYLRRDAGAVADEQLLVWVETEADLRLARGLTGYIHLRLYADASRQGFHRLQPPELFLTYERAAWDARGGVLVENWGIADTFNPLDVLNSRDFATDLLDPLKLGQAGVRFRLLFDGGKVVGEPTLSLYLMPTFTRTRYGPVGQRLAPAAEGLTFDERAGVEPDGSDRQLWALRYQSSLNALAFHSDIQAILSTGPDRTPVFRPFTNGRLAPVYQGVRTIGFGFRAVADASQLGRLLSTFTLKGEVAHRAFASYAGSPFGATDDYWTYVFGLDRDFPNVLGDRDLFTLTLEYVSETGASAAASRERLFQHDLIFRAFWQANNFSRTTLELRGVVDPKHAETILEAALVTRLLFISEDLRAELRYQYFDYERGSGTALSFLPDNSSLAIGLRWDAGGG